MKIGFPFFIFLLCCTGNTYGMLENFLSFKIDKQNPSVTTRATTSTEKKPINPTAVLIKACQSTTNPKATSVGVIEFLMERGANVNEPFEDTTALLAAIENPITEKDPYLIELLIAHATADHRNLALMEATRQEKWNTVALLQDRYGATLSDKDAQAIQSTSAATVADNNDDDISWFKRTTTDIKDVFLKALRKFRADHANDDNDLIAHTSEIAGRDITAQQATVPLNDVSMNIITMGGMPNS